MSGAIFAETLVMAFEYAAVAHGRASTVDARNGTLGMMEAARADLIQALAVPAPEHAEDFPTIRHEFAMRAPKKIPSWFGPKISERPKAPNRPTGEAFDAALRLVRDSDGDTQDWPKVTSVRTWNGDEVELTMELRAQVDEYVASYAAFQKTDKDWCHDVNVQTVAQWPWAWADTVMAAGKATP